MTLVLVFGMQDTADALRFGSHTSSDGDLKTVFQNQPFTIRVPVTLQSPSRLPGYKPVPSTDGAGTAVPAATRTNMYYDDTDGSGFYLADDPDTEDVTETVDTTVSYAAAHYYDQEQITIAVTGSAGITRIGSHEVPNAATTGFVMYERTHDSHDTAPNHQKLSGTFTLTLEPTGVGVVAINITNTTDAADFPGTTASDPIAFTVYVVNYRNSAPATALDFATGTIGTGTNYNIGRDDSHDDTVQLTVTPATNTQVTLEVIEGSGRLYVRKTYAAPAGAPASQSSPVRKLVTSSSAAVATGGDVGADVYLDMGGGTNKVKITAGALPAVTATFVYGYPTIEISDGNGQTGAPSGRLEDPLIVKVKDEKQRTISGAIVTFASSDTGSRFFPFPGTTVHIDTNRDWASSFSDIASINNPETATSFFPMTDSDNTGDNVLVETDRTGEAEVYFQLGSDAGNQTVTVAAVGAASPPTFSVEAATAGNTRAANLEILSGDSQRGEKGKFLEDPLVVITRSTAGHRIPNVIIQFRSIAGLLSPAQGTLQPAVATGARGAGELPQGSIDPTPSSGQQIYVKTGADGQARINYNIGQTLVARDVIAEIRFEADTTQYDFAIDRVVFKVNGGSTPTEPAEPAEPAAPVVTQVSVPSTVSGTAGGTATLTLTAPATASVTAGGLNDTFPLGNASSFTGAGTTTRRSTLTLPDTAGDYSLTVFVGNTSHQVTVRVTAAQVQTGELTLTSTFSGAPGSQSTVTVKATHADGTAASGVSVSLRVTSGGGTFSPATVTTGADGTAISTFTRGTTAGTNYFITVSASDYDPVQQRISITGTAPGSTQQQAGAAGEAEYLELYDGDNQRGSLNTRLSELLVVEVLDAREDPVEDVRVRFRTSVGSGTFSPRTVRTDEDGFAEVRFTPTSSGRIVVVASVTGIEDVVTFSVTAGEAPETLAKVSGDAQNGTPGRALADPFVVVARDEAGDPVEGVSVTFAVSAGGGSLSETSAVTNANGRAETTLTLGSQRGINSVSATVTGLDPVSFSTSIEPKVLVAAANRPVLYWSDGGTVYQLAGATTTKIAESVNGFAVGGGKVYWTTQTGPSAGSIHSANLDGTGATTLNTLMAVPMGIAVDTAGSKLYWTNSRGRVQSGNLTGKSIQNLVQNRSGATDIVVGSGYIYWIENGNSIRRAPMTGRKTVTDVAVNLSDVGGIAVSGSKVYWTEQTGASSGTVNGADLDGTNFSTLATLLAAPMGIAVDTAGSKLYWTNSRGRVQSANRDGSKIRNVVEGLISPSKLVIGGANTAVVAQQQPTQPAATAKDTSAYDVNGDGTVDNIDAGLVADALGTSNATYDVNGDGTVNFLDLLLVFDNRDDDAAGAPTIVGLKMTPRQVEVLQEQIDLLIATGDRSPAALRTLVYLQQLLATARPEKTQLLANYPNPFNPETWIPYELATDTDVRLTIYNAQGVVVRVLHLGQQAAGYYTDRQRAAYWDGRNALGEQVASGIYFYQLETDDMSSLRKMVILK